MNKIIKTLIIIICLFNLFNIKTVSAQESSNSQIVEFLANEEVEVEDTKSNSSNSIIFLEIFCAVIAVFMLFIAYKTTEKD